MGTLSLGICCLLASLILQGCSSNRRLLGLTRYGLYTPLLLSLTSGVAAASVSFKPTAGATWNIYLSESPTEKDAKDQKYHVWDFDMAEAPKSLIDTFHTNGHPVICYFSAGTKENYRADADQFPANATGNVVDGWPQEHWVDVRSPAIREIMKQRMDEAQSKGCDGIDPDNIDGYENDSGFDLTKDDAVDYLQFMADYAHDRGMAFGLKNGDDLVDRVVDFSQWVIIEQCVKYNECDEYQHFIKQNKPAFHIEYSSVEEGCKGPNTKGFSTLIKKLSLNSWTRTCPS